MEDWLDSCERYFRWKDQRDAEIGVTENSRFHRLHFYGSYHFNRMRFRLALEGHAVLVEHHFRSRPHDLLTLNIVEGDGWELLCDFLGVKPPQAPFPKIGTFESLKDGSDTGM